MELNRIQIKNFRSIQDATIEFDPRCRILVGKNEVGKTNLLSACALLDEARTVSPSDLRESRDEEPPVESGYVWFVFRLSLEEISSVKNELKSKIHGFSHDLCVLEGKKISASDFISLFNEWLYIVDLPSGKRSYSYWSKAEYKILPGWLMPKKSAPPSTLAVLSSGEKALVSDIYFAHSTEIDEGSREHFEPATITHVAKKIASEADKILEPLIPQCMLWKYAEENLLPQSISIDAFKADPRSCEPLRAMFCLAGIADSPSAIGNAQSRPNGLKNLLTRVARTTTDHIKKRWKELGAIEIVLSPNGSQIDAAVKDQYNEYSFSRRSDGFKRFVSFLIMISARSVAKDFSKCLFIQDEPDLGLHPSGAKSLLKELIELSKSNFVLISTHSIFMIDKERIDRHMVVQKQNEATNVSAVDQSKLIDEEVLYNALGYSIFELIRPINFVFEGWRDKKLFLTALSGHGGVSGYLKKKMASEVGATHAMGVKDIAKVVMQLEAMSRKTITITDSDDVAKEQQRRFDADKSRHQWYRYDQLLDEEKTYTAEDFIVAARLSEALRAVFAENGIDAAGINIDFSDREKGATAIAKGVIDSIGGSQRDLLDRWKSEIFDNLEHSQIKKEYRKILEAIAMKIGWNSNLSE